MAADSVHFTPHGYENTQISLVVSELVSTASVLDADSLNIIFLHKLTDSKILLRWT